MTVRCLIDFPHDHRARFQGRFESPREVLQARRLDDVTPLLQKAEAHAKKGGWATGMVSYEAASAFDPALVTHLPAGDLPLAVFSLYDKAPAAIDTTAVTDFSCSPWQNNIRFSDFKKNIDAIRDAIAEGDYYQTNFTSRLASAFKGDAESFFHALCAAQPGGYSFFMDGGDWQIASVSPELFFAWDTKTKTLTTRPMKGTASLHGAADALKNSEKDRAENLMIVDLLRNDISRIAGDVRVPELYAVQSLATVQQMTSTVTGITLPKTGLADIFGALFPCGSVTGAPKIAAMQAIRRLETTPRGAYCGALGILQPGGDALFSVGIRSVVIANKQAVCGIGSGITWDSKPDDEWAEGQIKQRFLWRASAAFDLLETIRLENGQFWLLPEHLARMKSSAEYFGFNYDAKTVQSILDKLAEQNPAGIFRVRLLVNRKGLVKAEMDGLEQNPETVVVQLAKHPIAGDDEFIRHKTTNRGIYEPFTPATPDIFDTLLYNEHDQITEFTRGNVAIEVKRQLVTPPLACGLLAGTWRSALLADGKLTERIVTCDEVGRADKIWFFNSLRGMIPARLVA